MNGDAIKTPMYNPVACSPFIEDGTPFCSKIIARSGKIIPCEKPEMPTSDIKIQNLDLVEAKKSLPKKSFLTQFNCILIKGQSNCY